MQKGCAVAIVLAIGMFFCLSGATPRSLEDEIVDIDYNCVYPTDCEPLLQRWLAGELLAPVEVLDLYMWCKVEEKNFFAAFREKLGLVVDVTIENPSRYREISEQWHCAMRKDWDSRLIYMTYGYALAIELAEWGFSSEGSVEYFEEKLAEILTNPRVPQEVFEQVMRRWQDI